MKKILFFIILISSCGRHNQSSSLPIVGLNSSNGPMMLFLPKKYEGKIGQSLNSVNYHLVNNLNNLKSTQKWDISRIDFNFVLSLKSDFKIIGLELSPSFRLVFEKE